MQLISLKSLLPHSGHRPFCLHLEQNISLHFLHSYMFKAALKELLCPLLGHASNTAIYMHLLGAFHFHNACHFVSHLPLSDLSIVTRRSLGMTYLCSSVSNVAPSLGGALGRRPGLAVILSPRPLILNMSGYNGTVSSEVTYHLHRKTSSSPSNRTNVNEQSPVQDR
jgi:hypothetical protein